MILEYFRYLYMFSSVCMMFYIAKNIESISVGYYIQKSNEEIEEDKSQIGLTVQLIAMVILSPLVFIVLLANKKK